MAPENTPALDVKQVSHELGVSTQLVRRLIKDGELRHLRLGRLIRIPRSELDRYVAENTANASQASA